MRCSADKDDPGYPNWRVAMANKKKITVTLGGVVQDHVITADEEKGFVRRLVMDANDCAKFDEERNRLVDEIVHGTVKIVMNPVKTESAG